MLIHQEANSKGNYNFNHRYYDNINFYYHFHNNYEIIYVISGQVHATIDNHTEDITEGKFALIMPNQLHSLSTPCSSELSIWVFSEEYIYRFSSETKNLIGKQANFDCTPQVHDFVIKHLMEEPSEDIDMRKACFYALCSEYKRQIKLMPRNSEDDTVFMRIVDYISSRFREPISLKNMASELGYDYHYLSRIFHNMFHMNFCNFVNQYRINYANQLLLQSNCSITDVAYECGFQSVRSFNNVYKKLIGCPPSQSKY